MVICHNMKMGDGGLDLDYRDGMERKEDKKSHCLVAWMYKMDIRVTKELIGQK